MVLWVIKLQARACIWDTLYRLRYRAKPGADTDTEADRALVGQLVTRFLVGYPRVGYSRSRAIRRNRREPGIHPASNQTIACIQILKQYISNQGKVPRNSESPNQQTPIRHVSKKHKWRSGQSHWPHKPTP